MYAVRIALLFLQGTFTGPCPEPGAPNPNITPYISNVLFHIAMILLTYLLTYSCLRAFY